MATQSSSGGRLKTASGIWPRFYSCILSTLVFGANLCVVALVDFGLLWLDNHWPVLLVFGRWNVRLNDLHHVPVWCIAGWAATIQYGCPLHHMIAGEALCQLVLYLTLPYFSLLRALMSYSWFCDQTTHQSHPMALVAYSFVCFGALVLHATCYYPKPAQSGQIDPLMTVDWDEVTARTARFRAREIAGYILEDIFARRRGVEPSTQKRTPAGLASLYSAAHTRNTTSHSAMSKGFGTDFAKPSTGPSTKLHDTGNTKEGPSTLSSSDTVNSGGATTSGIPVSQRRAPAGLAAVFFMALCSGMAPNHASVEALGSSAGDMLTPPCVDSSATSPIPSTQPLVDSSTTSSLASTSGVVGIPVGLAPGRTPTLSDKPILPARQTPPAAPGPTSAEATLAPAGPNPPPAAAMVTLTYAGITSVGAEGPDNLRLRVATSPLDSFIVSSGRQPSMGLPAAIPAMRVPSTTCRHLPAAKPDPTGGVRSTLRKSTIGKKTISVYASAEAKPTARSLARQSSSIKERLHEIRTQLGELTNRRKTRTSKTSSTKHSSSATKGNLKGITLERDSSWKAAAKAVKGGFTRRSNGILKPDA